MQDSEYIESLRRRVVLQCSNNEVKGLSLKQVQRKSAPPQTHGLWFIGLRDDT